VRLLGVAYMNRHLAWNLVPPDTRGVYRPLALSFADGHGYQLGGDLREATRVAPLFPVYLAGVYRVFGHDTPTWWLGVLNAGIRCGVTLLVYLLAARAFGRTAGLAAALLQALDPWEAFWTPFVLKETLAVFLGVLGFWWLARALDAPSRWRGLALGMVLGLAGLARFASLGLVPWALLVVAVAAARHLLAWRAALRLAMAALLGTLVALSPWLARNYALFGEMLVSTHFAGLYFYVSNGPRAGTAPETWGYSGASGAQSTPIVQARDAHATVAGQEWALAAYTMRHVVTHPADSLRLVASRVVNMWRPTFAGSSMSNLMVLGVPYCALMAVALVGGVVAWRQRPVRARAAATTRLVVWAALLFYVALHLAFWSEIRYRQYVMPFITVLAGMGVHAMSALRRLAPLLNESVADRAN
jgi:4-amino-4-deoxy-L-arabinose transferase-like glycosyltransferase